MITFKQHLKLEPTSWEEFNSGMDFHIKDELSAALNESLDSAKKNDIHQFMSNHIVQQKKNELYYLVVATFIQEDKPPVLQVSEKMKMINNTNGTFVFEKNGEKRRFPEHQDLGSIVKYYFLVKTKTLLNHFITLVTLKYGNKPIIRDVLFTNGWAV